MLSRLIVSLILLSSFVLPSYADVKIPKEHRVSNRPGGFCAWAALESIGRFYKDTRLSGLVDWYSQWPNRGATSTDVKACFANLGVKYQLYENGTTEFVKNYTDKGVPVVVGCKWTAGFHAIIVVDVDKDWVKYIDSNDTKHYYQVTRQWFDANFYGWVIIVEKT